MHESGLLPEGSFQLVIGSTGDLLDRLDGADAVTFTGSADTAAKLRVNKNLIANSVPFNAEADSLNCAILAPDVTPDDPEFDLFVKEVAREMTGKAGQKCTAIRRIIVPQQHVDAVARTPARAPGQGGGGRPVGGRRAHGRAGLAWTSTATSAERVEMLSRGNEVLFGARDGFEPRGEGVAERRVLLADAAAVPRRR